MWQRLIRLISTGLSAYSFYSKPLRFILSLLYVIAIPYLVYILWGGATLIVLAMLGVYLTYRTLKSKKKSNYFY